MTDYYNIPSPVDTLPVTLVEAQNWLRDIPSADESLVEDLLIPASTTKGEQYTGRVFITQTFEGYFDGLSASNCEQYQFVQINRAPLIAITSVETYVDDAYAAFTDYQLKETASYARLLFKDGITGVDSDAVYPLKVTFTAGYGTAATDIPKALKTAILEYVAFLYENRGDTKPEGGKGLPAEVKALYSAYRIITTF